jgi:hypothetical protein
MALVKSISILLIGGALQLYGLTEWIHDIEDRAPMR